MSKPDLVFDFPGRAVGDVQEMEIFRFGRPGTAFDDVGSDGNSTSPQLCR